MSINDLAAKFGDADQMAQVLSNLLINAQQAMQQQMGARRLVVATRRAASGKRVRLRVTDSGPGVLLSSGLIAGGAITGILLAALTARGLTGGLSLEETLGTFATSPAVATRTLDGSAGTLGHAGCRPKWEFHSK